MKDVPPSNWGVAIGTPQSKMGQPVILTTTEGWLVS